MKYNAYLDIETTGLSASTHELTVIGLHLDDGGGQVIQLVGDEISSGKLVEFIGKVDKLYTYNGERFDLPFIKERLKVDLKKYCPHIDLVFACHKNKLFGGLKAVERKVGIMRKLPGIDGRISVDLWFKYKQDGCADSLNTLLAYNQEDVLNLKILREKLNI